MALLECPQPQRCSNSSFILIITDHNLQLRLHPSPRVLHHPHHPIQAHPSHRPLQAAHLHHPPLHLQVHHHYHLPLRYLHLHHSLHFPNPPCPSISLYLLTCELEFVPASQPITARAVIG